MCVSVTKQYNLVSAKSLNGVISFPGIVTVSLQAESYGYSYTTGFMTNMSPTG